MKVLRKWEGPFWDHQGTSVVYLDTPEAMVAAPLVRNDPRVLTKSDPFVTV
jgi:hypothetical protein